MRTDPRRMRRRRLPGVAAGLLLGLAAACAPPVPQDAPPPAAALPRAGRLPDLQETPAPEGPWRAHRLAGCAEDQAVPARVERILGLCSEYFRDGSGSDGMIELELNLQDGLRHSLIDLTLGQLYLMAGQGEPALLPVEGPAADVGDWDRNRRRLLGRARQLLERAAGQRPDDAAVDYLLADVARAEGRLEQAAELMARGAAKCTGGRSFGILQLYQALNRYPPRYQGGPSPEYPASALAARVTGDVVLDLLLDPNGEVRQAVTVSAPAEALARAAATSLRAGRYEAARLGKYGVWCWLRVTTSFTLDGAK